MDLNTLDLEPGTLLWHYTDFKGLEGILAGTIWASSLPYLNDTEEFRHGAAIALEVLQNELTVALAAFDAAYASAIHGQLLAFFGNLVQPSDVFITALSKNQDDISQWRAYGGIRGPMFSIGFDPKSLEIKAQQSAFDLEEVKYRRPHIVADLRLAIRPAIASIIESLRERKGGPQCVPQWVAKIARELLVLIPRYKNPKFSDEEEWRLIRRQPILTGRTRLNLQFRQSGSLVVPFLAMPLHTPATEEDVFANGAMTESPIAAITIGPSPHPEQLRYAVGEMVARIGLPLVRVESSSVPFRNW
jgi:hypothetical protein